MTPIIGLYLQLDNGRSKICCLTLEEAIQVQTRLLGHLNLIWDEKRRVTTVGGVDIGIIEEKPAHCAIFVLRFPDLTPLESITAEVPLVFHYIPGLLSFRDGPLCWRHGIN